MPLYEYQCAECRSTTELLRPVILRDAPARCDGCGSIEASRLGTSRSASPRGRRAEPTVTGGGPTTGRIHNCTFTGSGGNGFSVIGEDSHVEIEDVAVGGVPGSVFSARDGGKIDARRVTVKPD